MRTLLSLCLLFLLSPAFAQTFMAKESEAILSFKGTLLTKGINNKVAITLRQSQTSQDLTVVMEVKHFTFPDTYQQDEFNDTFMESMYFPQIRISGFLKEQIDLTKDGSYVVTFPAKVSIRKVTQNILFNVKIEIKGQEAEMSFDNILTLADFYVPYSGEGSEIGKEAAFKLNAVLKRVH